MTTALIRIIADLRNQGGSREDVRTRLSARWLLVQRGWTPAEINGAAKPMDAPYDCPVCGVVFERSIDWMNHLHIAHPRKES